MRDASGVQVCTLILNVDEYVRKFSTIFSGGIESRASVRFMPRRARRSNKFMQVAAQYNEVGGNDAQPDFQRERHLIAVPSLLEGAVAPHRGAP